LKKHDSAEKHRIFTTSFASVYPHYVTKATKKGRTPAFHPNATKINGVVCGVRIEEIEHPLMRKIRYLDKLVDELAKGRPLEKVLRP
jgi:hypothetical protein